MTQRSLALLLFIGCAWSAKPALLKLALSTGLTRESAMLFMICGLGVLAALYLTASRSWPRLGGGLLIFILASAVTAQLIPIFVATLVAPELPIGTLALLVCTTPFFCALMSIMLRDAAPSPAMAGAIVLAALSAVILVMPGRALSADQMVWAGVLLLVPLSYAANQQIIFRYWPKGIDAWQLAGVETVAASLLMLPYYQFSTGLHLAIEPSFGHLVIALWITVTLAETVAFFALIAREGPVFVSLGAIVAVLVAPLWGLTLFNEEISAGYGWSAALFAGALLLLGRQSRQARQETAA